MLHYDPRGSFKGSDLPPPRLNPFLRLFFCAFGALVASVAVQIVIIAAVVTARQLSQQTDALEIQVAEFFRQQMLLVTVLTYPPALLWIWFCRRVFDRRSFVSLGLRRRRAGLDFTAGLVGGASAIGLLCGVLWLTGHVVINGWSPEVVQAGVWPSAAYLALWAGVFCLVGFMEEVSFRGYALHNLAAGLSLRRAVVVQAVCFALIHIGNVVLPLMQQASGDLALPSDVDTLNAISSMRWGLLNIALIGVFFALCYLKTGSLWFPIGFHAAWNFCQGCLFSLPVSGLDVFRLLDVTTSANGNLTGGTFGVEGSVLLVALNAAMIYLIAQAPQHPQATLDLALLIPPAPASELVPAAPETPLETPVPSRFKTRFDSTTRPAEEVDAFAASLAPALPLEPAPEPVAVTVSGEVAPEEATSSPFATPVYREITLPSTAVAPVTPPAVEPAIESVVEEAAPPAKLSPVPPPPPVLPSPPNGKPPAPKW